MKNSLSTIFLLFLIFTAKAQNRFGNEWLKDFTPIVKLSIAEKGIYRISFDDLLKNGVSIENLASSTFQLFHQGKEVPFLISSNNYIEFYAEGNNGEQDAELYRPQSARMNPYHSLYTDEAVYFLGIGKTNGKRIQIADNQNVRNLQPESYHLEQQLKVFNEQYSFNNSIGYPPNLMQSFFEVGEGWSGKIIMSDSLARFPIKLENYLPQSAQKPVLEALFNGRTDAPHDVRIFLQTPDNQNRTIGNIKSFGFETLNVSTEIQPNEIFADNTIQLRSQSFKKELTEWHSITYHRVTYPQSFDMAGKTTKYFYLKANAANESFVSIPNSPTNALVYQLTDRYNFQKINGNSSSNQLSFVVNNTQHPRTIYVSNEIKKPTSITKVSLTTDYLKPANYLIITHPTLLESAKQLANYRESASGGNHKTNILIINDLYQNFSYGERTPLAIRRCIDFLLASNQKIENLLLIGKGMSFPDILKTRADLDLVPTMGYPASDNLLTAGLNGFDENVQAIPTGRLSASTNQDVLNYLQKLKEYEANTSDLLWKKNVLHLSGGRSKTELVSFQNMLNAIQPKAINSFLNGKVKLIGKKSDVSVENVDISAEVNEGVGLITFMGHSSATVTDLNIGYVSNNPKFDNKPKYPLMYFNGCGVGNVFNTYNALTTDWLFTPNKGAIAMLANSFWSYDLPTSRYLNILYEKAFQDPAYAGESIGKIHQFVNKTIAQQGIEQYMMANLHQLVFQGDPAIRIFPLKNADYQADRIFIRGKNNSLNIASNDSLLVGFIASNSGRYEANQALTIQLKQTFASQSKATNYSVKNIGYRDTLYFPIKKDVSLQLVEIMIDSDNKITENNEKDNQTALKLDWNVAGSGATFPANILPDRLNPTLLVKFDDKKIKQAEFVSPTAIVSMILTDENLLPADTSLLDFYFQSCESCALQKVSMKNLQLSTQNDNTVVFQYKLPNLPKGTYKLMAMGRDASKNTTGNSYQISFSVAETALPTQIVFYPNPAQEFAVFQWKIIDRAMPKWGKIEIYDTRGILIKLIDFQPTIGENELFLDVQALSAGIYFYKAHLELSNGDKEEFKGKFIVD